MDVFDRAVSVLEVIAGPDAGRRMDIGCGIVRVGRGLGDDFLLQDVSVTRCQLIIEWDARSDCHIAIQAGDSCTAFNGIAAGRNAGVRHKLANGDQVRIGTTVLRYSRSPVTVG